MKNLKQRESDGPRPVDIHVRQPLHGPLTLMGLSQERLGESVRVTFQQIQKHRRGAQRAVIRGYGYDKYGYTSAELGIWREGRKYILLTAPRL
jgi:hypothetical protein